MKLGDRDNAKRGPNDADLEQAMQKLIDGFGVPDLLPSGGAGDQVDMTMSRATEAVRKIEEVIRKGRAIESTELIRLARIMGEGVAFCSMNARKLITLAEAWQEVQRRTLLAVEKAERGPGA